MWFGSRVSTLMELYLFMTEGRDHALVSMDGLGKTTQSLMHRSGGATCKKVGHGNGGWRHWGNNQCLMRQVKHSTNVDWPALRRSAGLHEPSREHKCGLNRAVSFCVAGCLFVGLCLRFAFGV